MKKETYNRKRKLDFDEVMEIVPAKTDRPFMLGVDRFELGTCVRMDNGDRRILAARDFWSRE